MAQDEQKPNEHDSELSDDALDQVSGGLKAPDGADLDPVRSPLPTGFAESGKKAELN